MRVLLVFATPRLPDAVAAQFAGHGTYVSPAGAYAYTIVAEIPAALDVFQAIQMAAALVEDSLPPGTPRWFLRVEALAGHRALTP